MTKLAFLINVARQFFNMPREKKVLKKANCLAVCNASFSNTFLTLIAGRSDHAVLRTLFATTLPTRRLGCRRTISYNAFINRQENEIFVFYKK